MQAIRKSILKHYEPNTFIGGVAATINSANLLAEKLNLSVSRIQGFKVVNNDIEFTVTGGSYVVETNTFNQPSLTFVIDKLGKISTIRAIENLISLPNLKQIYFPGITLNMGAGGGFVTMVNFPAYRYMVWNALKIEHGTLSDLPNLEKLIFNNLDQISIQSTTRYIFRNLINLKRMVVPKVVNMSWQYTVPNACFNVKLGCVFYLNPIFQSNNFANLQITINGSNLTNGDSVTINGNTYVCGNHFNIGPNNQFQTAQSLSGAINNKTGTLGIIYSQTISGLNTISAFSSLIGTLGNGIQISTSNPLAFTFSKPSLLNGGDEHEWVTYLRSRNCDIRYVTNSAPPNAPVGLNYSNLNSTTVQLNFTPAIPNTNAVDGYEVWISDGVNAWMDVLEYAEIINSGDTIDISQIPNGTRLEIKIRTFDYFYNLSTFSNKLILIK